MQSFTKPAKLNGATLIEELEAAGIEVQANGIGIKCPSLDSDNTLWLDIAVSDKDAAEAIINNHKG